MHQAGCTPPLRLPSTTSHVVQHDAATSPVPWGHLPPRAVSHGLAHTQHSPKLRQCLCLASTLTSSRFNEIHESKTPLQPNSVVEPKCSSQESFSFRYHMFMIIYSSIYIFAFCSFLRQGSWHDDVCNSDDKTWLTNGTLGHINNYWARFYPLVIWHNYGQPPFFTGKSWIFYGLSSIANSKFTGWYTWWIFQPLDGQHASCLPVARRPP